MYPSELSVVIDAFSNLCLPDPMPLLVTMGSIAGSKFEGKPVHLFLIGPPSCQPKGSQVLMADGSWKNVEDVRVGEYVMSPQHDGTMLRSRVTDTFSVGNREIFEVRMLGRMDPKTKQRPVTKSYRCADNHIVPHVACVHKYLGGGAGAYRPKPTQLRERAASDLPAMGKHYLNKARVFTTPGFNLPRKKYAVHPYVLGVFLGDGCWSKQRGVTLTSGDEIIFERVRSHGIVFGKSYHYANHEDRRIRKPYDRAFRKLKCFGTGSASKFVPKEYLTGSMQQRLELLAGLIDTDGSCREFTSVSKQLCEDFKYLVHSVGGTTGGIRERWTRSSKASKLYRSYRINYCFGKHVPPVSLKHKSSFTDKIEVRNGTMQVVDTGKREDVYGFSLDSPSQWYVTDDWLVTHNSGKNEILEACFCLPNTHHISTFNEAAMLSGTSKKDRVKEATGGYLKLVGEGNEGLFIMTEFNSILCMHPDKRANALSTLQNICTGFLDRGSGADGGMNLHWRGKIQVLAACTENIEEHRNIMNKIGERFIYCRLPKVDRKGHVWAALRNARNGMAAKFEQQRAEAMKNFFANLKMPRCPEEMIDETDEQALGAIADFSTLARSSVVRDDRRDVVDIYEAEGPARMTVTLQRLLCGLRVIGVPYATSLAYVARVALGSIPKLRRALIDVIANAGGDPVTTAQIREQAGGYRDTVIRRGLEELEIHGILRKFNGHENYWSFTEEALENWYIGFGGVE